MCGRVEMALEAVLSRHGVKERQLQRNGETRGCYSRLRMVVRLVRSRMKQLKRVRPAKAKSEFRSCQSVSSSRGVSIITRSEYEGWKE